MDRIITHCGLVCTDCPAYIATQANDHAALEKAAAKWREEYNVPGITTAESVICDGCLGDDSGRLSGYCSMCEIRACGVERGVANCAHCADYARERLENFFGFVPDAGAVLDQIWHSL